MDKIKILVEELIQLSGITGVAVPVVRHVLLIIVAVLLSMIAYLICRKLFVPLITKLTRKTETQWDDVIFNHNVLVSACHIVPAIVIWQLLPLVFYQYPTVREALARLTAVYITVMSIKLGIVFINSLKSLDSKFSTSTQQYMQSFCGVLKIVLIFVGVIVSAALLLGKSPLALFAGLGATSAVLMLVFKDTIEGLGAGIRLTGNEMVHKGDWITVDGTKVDGIVEDITLTTVKVRNFDNTILTVSPLTLVNGSFQNWKGMLQSAGRRVNRTVFFDFRSVKMIDDNLERQLLEKRFFDEAELKDRTVVNMGLYRRYIEKYLAEHKEVNENMTIVVRQKEATQAGLPIEFTFFLKDKDAMAYEHNLAEIMESIYALAPVFGLTIYQQYPEQ